MQINDIALNNTLLSICKKIETLVDLSEKIKFNVNLMECEILFFKAWAYNGLGFALKGMNSDNFYKIYNNEITTLINNMFFVGLI